MSTPAAPVTQCNLPFSLSFIRLCVRKHEESSLNSLLMRAVASLTGGGTQTLVNSEETVCFLPLRSPPPCIDPATCITRTVVLIQPVSAFMPDSLCVSVFSFHFQHSFFFPKMKRISNVTLDTSLIATMVLI